MRLRRESGDFEIEFDLRDDSLKKSIIIRKGLGAEDLLGLVMHVKDGNDSSGGGYRSMVRSVSDPITGYDLSGNKFTYFSLYDSTGIEFVYYPSSGQLKFRN